MFQKLRKLRESENGAVAVEFAMVIPVTLALTFFFFELCRIVFLQNVLSYSAAQASRYAMVHFDNTSVDSDYLDGLEADIKTYAKRSMYLIDDNLISDFTITTADPDDEGRRNVDISISYSYSPMMPLLSELEVTMKGESKAFLVQGID
ncbi:TadE/TadG family type IV pilus assembly protein [Pseudemcibacter aquimaris]|uniref:TadE/TadG family type IV pilus assembly protein n=1 Tax=Pseudemcibacter aquimaris TaxID=2857064 RepID=UPI002011114C|nr:TadE family protein [Pseudemcibacter aquimaris]MCC3862233.1 pilus assembly protein [Pseudemcibacter aquimaris]WDU58985.1 pilus assembly protein [Pseudemcibacter aquimaris]